MMLYVFFAVKDHNDGNFDEFGMLTFAIVSTNSVINPIVYMTRNMEMKTYAKKLCGQFVHVVGKSPKTNTSQVDELEKSQN